jgi:hypothetical protein
MLVGVVLPGNKEAMIEMAYVFAEEFARQGYDKTKLLWLFKNPFYAGAHGAYKALGDEAIRTIMDECLAVWGRIQFSTADSGLPIDSGEIKNRKAKTQNETNEH